jgi:hypothetical protein
VSSAWNPRRVLAGALAMSLLLGLAACTKGPGRGTPGSVEQSDDSRPAITFVAIGGSESTGRTQPDPQRPSWTQLVFRETLPRRAIYINLAETGARIDRADAQAALAIAYGATLATVWFGPADTSFETPAAEFRRKLMVAVHRLRRAGVRVLLVSGGSVAGYDEEIAAVAAAEGAQVVDLGDLSIFGDDAQTILAGAIGRAFGPFS